MAAKRRRQGDGSHDAGALGITGKADHPYAVRLPDGRTLALEIPARWVVRDRGGSIAFLPEAVEYIEHLRVLFTSTANTTPSPGHILRLREALGLSQAALGARVGVSKMTVSRWERGTMQPGPAARKALERVRREALRRGVALAS